MSLLQTRREGHAAQGSTASAQGGRLQVIWEPQHLGSQWKTRKDHTGLRVQKRSESSEVGPVIAKQATQASEAGRAPVLHHVVSSMPSPNFFFQFLGFFNVSRSP